MINSKSAEVIGRGKQLPLFEKMISDPGPHLKAAMKETIQASTRSREQIVDEMNRLASIAGITCNGKNQKVTATLLDKWVAPGSMAYMIPIRLLPFFCAAAGSFHALVVFATFFAGARVVGEEDLKKLRWAEAEISARKEKKLARRLAEEVGL